MKMQTKWARMVGIAGAAASATLLWAFHLWPGPVLLQILRHVNFLNFDLCDRVVASLFNPPPLAPPPQQSAIFAACLIVTAGIQWFIVGLLVDWLVGRLRSRADSHPLGT